MPRRATAGEYRQRVSWLAHTGNTQDARGQRTPAYASAVPLRAKVRQVRGRELERAKQVHKDVSWRVELWATKEITTKDQIVYDGRTLEVVDVDDTDQQNHRLVFLCKEVSA